ncbi:MAG: hypothetical protein AAGA77_17150 [Bacteroidota bacterium]
MKNIIEPTVKAKKEAYNNPNGWVYVIDEKYKNQEKVPPEYIVGAWKVNEIGVIEGNFIPNPNYKP